MAGDVITAVDGKEVASPKELARIIGGIAARQGGRRDRVAQRQVRDASRSISANCRAPTSRLLGRTTSKAPAQADQLADLGLTVTPSDDGKGVVVTDVDPSSDAADRGLQAGDVITNVNSQARLPAAATSTSRDGRRRQGRPQGGAGAGHPRRRQPLRHAAGRQGLMRQELSGLSGMMVLQPSSCSVCMSMIFFRTRAGAGSCLTFRRQRLTTPEPQRRNSGRPATVSRPQDARRQQAHHRLLPEHRPSSAGRSFRV